MKRIVVLPAVYRDLRRLTAWLAPKSPAAAAAAEIAMFEAMQSLGEMSDRGRPVHRVLRELAVDYGRDGYVLRYRSSATVVTITRIFHARELR